MLGEPSMPRRTRQNPLSARRKARVCTSARVRCPDAQPQRQIAPLRPDVWAFGCVPQDHGHGISPFIHPPNGRLSCGRQFAR